MSKRKPELKLVEDTGSQLDAEDLIPELPPQQSEMPFAVVEGERLTELPRDLYIPPDALQVFLEAFEGPLDLLLYLIRKQNLDILDIPIAEITRQYMKYIEVMADLQLELAGEYLLMAAMLAEIKSRMLLPRPPSTEGQDEDDPRAELVRRLQEYERFKKAAEDIDRLSRLERDTMTASAELEERQVVKMVPDVTLQEMLMAFKDVLSRAEKFAHHHISRERLSQRERMSDILIRLQTAAFLEFTQLFKPEEGRMGVTVTFIAILELMKEGLIEIVQAEAFAPIHVRTAQGQRHLKVVPGGAAAEADAENEAALAQPTLPDENDLPEDDEPEVVEAPVAEVVAGELVAEEPAAEVPASDEPVTTELLAEEPAAEELVVDELAAEEPVAADLLAEEPPVDEHAAEELTAEEPASSKPLTTELLAEVPTDEELVAEESLTAEVLEHEPTADELAVDALAAQEPVAAELLADEPTVEELVVDEPAAEEQVAAELSAQEPMAEEQAAEEPTAEVTASNELLPTELLAEEDAAAESLTAKVLEGEPTAEELAVEELVAQEPVAVELLADEPTLEALLVEEPAAEEPVAAELSAEEPTAEELALEEPAAEQPVTAELLADEPSVEELVADELLAQEPTVVGLITEEPAAEQPASEDAVFAEHAIPEHEIQQHVVEEHIVEEHVVEETVAQDGIRAGVADQDDDDLTPEGTPESIESTQLSAGDDSVTEPTDEADNSDAEPSR